MPELAEVEQLKNYLLKCCINKTINKVLIRDENFLEISETELNKTLKNKRIESIQRHGKYLFVDIGNKFIVLHFGMTGDVQTFKNIKNEPKFSKVLFKFTDGSFLSYISIRKFGKILITNNAEQFIENRKFGPDALKMSLNEFQNALKRRSAYIKSTLMNQEVIAGLGNLYSDEVLYQSKIFPKKKTNLLTKDDIENLFNCIKSVLKVAIDKKGHLEQYPQNFIIPHRDLEEKCPRCNGILTRYEISGRHGFYCGKCQK